MWVSLLGLLMVWPPLTGPTHLKMDGNSSGTLIWAETFEGTTPVDWFFDDDDPNQSGFRHKFGADAFEGRGYLEIRGREAEAVGCNPKAKTLMTAEIPTDDWQEIQIHFKTKAVAAEGQESLSFAKLLRMGKASSQHYPAKMDFGTPIITDLADGWQQVVFIINITAFAGESFPFTLTYRSTRTLCPTLLLDDFAVFGATIALPDTAILTPDDLGGARLLGVGETLTFEAEAVPNDPDANFRWFLLESRNDEPLAQFEGRRIEATFPQPGQFAMVCQAVNEAGADPTPAFRLLEVRSDRDLDTEIIAPVEPNIPVPVGGSITMQAQTNSSDPANTRILWVVFRDNADRAPIFQAEGNTVTFTFPEEGRFAVLAVAEDANGFRDRTPAVRNVDVYKRRLAIVEPRPSGRLPETVLPVNETIAFRAVVDDTTDRIDHFFWLKLPSEEPLCVDQMTCPMGFAEPGQYRVALVAAADSEVLATDYLNVFVDPPIYARIESPMDRQRILMGEPLRLSASLSGSLIQQAEVFWLLGDMRIAGADVTLPDGLSSPGHYQARIVLHVPGTDHSFQRAVSFHVVDPNAEPSASIIQPRTNTAIGAGETLFFEAGLRNIPLDAVTPYWEVVDLADESILTSATGRVLGRVTFAITGSYEARLFLRLDRGDVLVDQRAIEVGTVDATAFTDNIAPEQAAPIDAGRYDGLSLGRNHFFLVHVPEDGMTVDFALNLESPARLIIAPLSGNRSFERIVADQRSFQLSRLTAGDYRVGIVPVDSTNKRASFSFAVSVLNPGLYYPDVADDPSRETTVGMVNPTDADADIEILAYDTDGNILDVLTQTLSAKGNYRDTVANLFADQADKIAWIRVDSTHALVGYSRTVSMDDLESYGISAAQSLRDELFVPHIAEDSTTWSTRAFVVNGKAEPATPRLLAGETEVALNNGASYAKDQFEFATKLGQAITPATSWGRMLDNDNQARLAGSEVFGKVDGTRQVVGLGLDGLPEDNPNFTSSIKNLYFTHIANVDQFWTGITLVNTSDATQAMLIRAFGANGEEVGQKTLSLEPGEKRLELADAFLSDIGGLPTITWFEVEADLGIVGYELFGTYDVRQMAGIEAISSSQVELCFPFIDTSGQSWHGIALVNVSDTPTPITFTLHDTQGSVIASVAADNRLNGKEKTIFLLRSLFDGIPEAAAWLGVTADQPLAGFQLFGNNQFDHMSGLIAQ